MPRACSKYLMSGPAITVCMRLSQVCRYLRRVRACVGHSIQGTYQLKRITFDAALLRNGANVLALKQTRARGFANIMYDAIRLEVPSGGAYVQPR